MKKRTLVVLVALTALSGCGHKPESALEKQTVEGMRAAGLSNSFIKAHLAQAEKQQKAFDESQKVQPLPEGPPLSIPKGGVGFGSFPPPKQ